MEGRKSSKGSNGVSYGGYRVSCPPRVQQHTRVRMLCSKVRAKRKTWLIAAEQPVDLLFFRAIFSELQKRQHHGAASEAHPPSEDRLIPVEAFQIAMERLFFALGDTDGFDARSYDTNGDGSVEWSEFFRVYRERELTIRLSIFERIYLTFEHPDSSYLSQAISNMILLTIVASSLSFILGTMPTCKMSNFAAGDSPDGFCRPLKGIELGCLFLFILEYVLRLCTCWAVRPMIGDQAKLLELVVGYEAINLGHPMRRLWAFIVAPSNLIDAAAILPGVLSRLLDADGGAFVILRLVRLTRILRAFKSPALSEAVRVITLTMQQSTQALYILSFNLMLGIVIFGSLMYMAEGGPELNAFDLGGRWNDNLQAFERPSDWKWDGQSWVAEWELSDFQSIPEACWWAVVTVTTVGYGDKSPTTTLGKIVGVATMLFSLVILALPVGVIGGTFSNVWEQSSQEKQAQEQQLKRDLKFVAHELSRLEPIVMSRLMLIEVWHDENILHEHRGDRPPPSSFMGEAKVQLFITPHLPCSHVCTVPLTSNPEIAKRSITGKITLQYDWSPEIAGQRSVGSLMSEDIDKQSSLRTRASRASGDVEPIEPANSHPTKLRGSLRVTILSGDGLINLNTHRRGSSSPYCLVLCYPKRDEQAGLPEPCIWRTPTVRETLCPYWGVAHDFEFKWNASKHLDYARNRTWSVTDSFSPLMSPRERSGPEAEAAEVSSMVSELHQQLEQHKAEARLVRQAVRGLMQNVSEQLVGNAQRSLAADAPSSVAVGIQRAPGQHLGGHESG